MFDYRIHNPENTMVIENVSNGFILTCFGESEDNGEPFIYRTVFDIENNVGEMDYEKLVPFLWTILELFDIYNSKHNKQMLEINVVNNKEEIKNEKE